MIDEKFMPATEEIIAIMKKYDLGGSVFLSSEKGNHFYHGWDTPTWSCLKYEDVGEGQVGIRIKASSSVEGDPKKLLDTATMILTLRDQMINTATNLTAIEQMMAKHVGIMHKSQIGRGPKWTPGK